MDILLGFIITLISLSIGYMLGRETSPKEVYKKITKAIKSATTPVGPINRPSAETVNLWSNPKKLEEDQAMSDSLKRDLGEPGVWTVQSLSS